MDFIEIASPIASLGALIVSIFALNQSRKANKLAQEINYNEYYRLTAEIVTDLELIKLVTTEKGLNDQDNFIFVQKKLIELDDKIGKIENNLELPKSDLNYLIELESDVLDLFEYLNHYTFDYFANEVKKLIKKLKKKIKK